MALGCWATVAATGAEPRVSVAYEAAKLTVEAQGASLAEVLREVGAKVGFGVIDSGVPRSPLTFSLKDVALDVLLRRLLAAENHAIVYRADESAAGARIESIVLLDSPAGPSARGAPSPSVLDTPSADPPQWSGTPYPVSTPSGRVTEDEPGATPQVVRGTSRSPAEPVASSSPSRSSTIASPPSAPSPDAVKQQILERVRTMVDAVRRATLDSHRPNP